MFFSLIIPTYNEAPYILKCLASLQKQQIDHGDNLEIILIDDGSTDQTINKVKSFLDNQEQLYKVALLHQQHQGPAVARNRGAKYAKGDILILIDADMEFEPDFVKHLVQPIKMGKVKGTFSKQEYVANWESAWARCWNWNQNLPSRSRLPADHPNVGTDFRAILKSEFQRVNGFDDVGYTDTWTLPKKLGYQPIHAPGAKFYHYNPTSLHEIFAQARWASKRQYKLGLIGKGTALIRASLPVSLAVGIVKSLRYLEPAFLIFKIVYDLGTTIGIIENTLTGKTAK